MPKKEKISEEQKEEETRDESELEEEIKEDEFEEIAEKVSGENSTGKLIDETSFREFIQPSTKSTALVLEKIADAQEVGWVRREDPLQSRNERSERSDDSFKYNSGEQEKKDEPKYINSSRFEGEVSKIDFAKAGRDQPVMTQETRLKESSELKDFESPMQEKYTSAERIDPTKIGREDPFEKKKVDYFIK